MRIRIPYITLDEKIASRKRALAMIIVNESNCSMTRAYQRINFNLAYKNVG